MKRTSFIFLATIIFMGPTVGYALAGTRDCPLLITPAQLAEHDDVTLVDTREPEPFMEQRIPDAVLLDVRQLVRTHRGLSWMTLPPQALAEMVAGRGINPETLIVVYGEGDSPGAVSRATRVFWTLEYLGYPRVALLDGGLRRWLAENRPTVSGPPGTPVTPPPLPEDALQAALNVDKQYVFEAIDSEHHVIVDTREPRQYTGRTPVRGVPRNGFIPGAINIPHMTMLQIPDMTFKPAAALEQLLYPEGVTRDKEIILYCNIGNSCTVVYFAYRLLGHKKAVVYDGSMIEWAADPNMPLMTEEP